MGGIPASENQIPQRRWRQRLAVVAAMGFALLCGLYVVRAGVLVGGPYRAVDAYWQYAAGRCWLHGESPYDVESFLAHWRQTFTRGAATPYVYPPTMAILAVPLALLPWSAAQWVFDGVNLVALLGILYLGRRLIEQTGLIAFRSPGKWVWLGAACLISGVVGCIFVGQVGLIAVAGVVGALYAWQRGWWVWCAVFVVVATAKPQISLLPLVYMLVADRRRGVILGGLAAAAISALVVLWAPGESLWNDVRQSIDGFQSIPFNQWQRYDTLSRVLGGSTAGSMGVYAGVGAAIVLVCVVAIRDGLRIRNLRPAERGGRLPADTPFVRLPGILLVLAATGLFMPLHLYDFGVYAPVMVSLAAFGWCRRLWLLPGLILIARPDNIEAAFAHIPFCREWAAYVPVALVGGLATFVGAAVLYVRQVRLGNDCPPSRSVAT